MIAGALSAASFDDWWYAMVTYRSQGDSLFSGSPVDRADLFKDSLPAVAMSIGVLVALAAIGWRRGPLLLRLWVAAAALSVLGGGNFHPHYYLQLCAPLAALGGVGAARLLTERPPLVAGRHRHPGRARRGVGRRPVGRVRGTSGSARCSPRTRTCCTPSMWSAGCRTTRSPATRCSCSGRAPTSTTWPTAPPAVPYLWYRNIQAIPGALDQVRESMASPDGPRYIVGLHKPHKLDKSGKTYKLLRDNFHRVGKVDGIVIYERN